MKKILLLITCLSITYILSAQKKKPIITPLSTVQKIPLTHDVYDSWKEIGEKQLTNDGSYLVYALNPQEGDGRLVFHSLKSAKIDSVKRGAELGLTQDAEFAVFKIKPQLNATKEAKRAKKKKEDLPKDSLGIYALKTNQLTKIPAVQSYKIIEKGSGWLAYLLEAGKAEAAPKKDSLNKVKPKKIKKESEETGFRLVLRNLKTNVERTFGFVSDYEFSKFGKRLIFNTSGNDSTLKSGVYVFDLEKGILQNIFQNKGKFKKLALAEDGTQAAFIADLDTNSKTQIRLPKLYHWKEGQTVATLLKSSESVKDGKALSFVNEYTAPRFSQDGSKLYFGMNPKPILQDTTLLPDEIVNVEVWNWQDKRLQPQQKVTLEQDRKRAYWAVVNLSNLQIIQLTDPSIPDIHWDKEANKIAVLATSTRPYSNEHWDWNNAKDIYLISTQDGSRKKIASGIKGNQPIQSPEGEYVVWWSLADTAWFSYSVKDNRTLQLTDNKTVKFYEEDDDHPDYPSPYGIGGWHSKNVLTVYDRYNVWLIAVDSGEKAKIATANSLTGKVQYRVYKTDIESKYISGNTYHFTNTDTKEEGFVSLGNNEKVLLRGNASFSNPIKAKDADIQYFTKQTFQDAPDLHVADMSFQNIQKISDANPQQKNYLWGTVELVNWRANDGTPLQGLLYKPENFDPTKKYPMVVYYYEKNTDNLHQYVAPSPIRASINYSYFTSNGYVVFVPDIVYQVGYPGPSAYNCIIPGVLSLIDKGFVNKDRIGIQGHSWGGYQSAYLVTQTNLFRCAEAGAPVANMTSAYGGIRWETGVARQAQYENTQSRIGGTLWEKPMQFLENSPLFSAPKVQTPVLMMANDDDGAVPWYQGIEFYLALKRLNKPVWMLNYNGEKHGLTQRKNRKDFAKRMYQYFDHYLKDAPAPEWMTEGLPMMEKGINQHLGLGKE